MKGNLFINFLIQKDFLNTRSRRSSFLLTNPESAHLITHEPMKANEASRYKGQIKVQICVNRQRASERRANEGDISFESF